METRPPSSQTLPADGTTPEAWVRWLDATGPPSMLLAIERRMGERLRLHCDAEDIWQETLVHAWRDRERFDWRGIAAFRRWLLTIAERRIQDGQDRATALKRRGERCSIDSEDTGSLPLALLATSTPSRVAVVRERADELRRALESLPETLRTVLEMRIVDGLDTRETAQRLQIGASAVKHRLRKAAVIFRARLQPHLSTRWQADSSNQPGGDSSLL